MGEIVNLRQVKKRRAKVEAAATAAENRVRHGRTGAVKQAERLEQARRETALDGSRVEHRGSDASGADAALSGGVPDSGAGRAG